VLKIESTVGWREGPAAVGHQYLPAGRRIAAQGILRPKLLAPIEYRGPLGTVKTSSMAFYFSEMLKQTAQIADASASCAR